MLGFIEVPSNLLRNHKGKIAGGSLLLLAGACGIYNFINSGQQEPPINEIAPIIQPTDDFGSGGGGIEDDVMPQSGIGCWDAYGIDFYSIGAVTKYTHSECLGNSLWKVPDHGGTILYQAPQLPPPSDP